MKDRYNKTNHINDLVEQMLNCEEDFRSIMKPGFLIQIKSGSWSTLKKEKVINVKPEYELLDKNAEKNKYSFIKNCLPLENDKLISALAQTSDSSFLPTMPKDKRALALQQETQNEVRKSRIYNSRSGLWVNIDKKLDQEFFKPSKGDCLLFLGYHQHQFEKWREPAWLWNESTYIGWLRTDEFTIINES